MIDVIHQINSVRRQVGKRMLEAGEARIVTVSQTYNAAIDDVWDACTNPERIPRWFLPISGDLRLDGRYQLQGNAGGVIERCDPPTSFAATWEYGRPTREHGVDGIRPGQAVHVAQQPAVVRRKCRGRHERG